MPAQSWAWTGRHEWAGRSVFPRYARSGWRAESLAPSAPSLYSCARLATRIPSRCRDIVLSWCHTLVVKNECGAALIEIHPARATLVAEEQGIGRRNAADGIPRQPQCIGVRAGFQRGPSPCIKYVRWHPHHEGRTVGREDERRAFRNAGQAQMRRPPCRPDFPGHALNRWIRWPPKYQDAGDRRQREPGPPRLQHAGRQNQAKRWVISNDGWRNEWRALGHEWQLQDGPEPCLPDARRENELQRWRVGWRCGLHQLNRWRQNWAGQHPCQRCPFARAWLL